MERFSVCLLVHPSIWLASWLGLRYSWLGLKPGWLHGPEGRTDKQTKNLLILQDFVLGLLPKKKFGGIRFTTKVPWVVYFLVLFFFVLHSASLWDPWNVSRTPSRPPFAQIQGVAPSDTNPGMPVLIPSLKIALKMERFTILTKNCYRMKFSISLSLLQLLNFMVFLSLLFTKETILFEQSVWRKGQR